MAGNSNFLGSWIILAVTKRKIENLVGKFGSFGHWFDALTNWAIKAWLKGSE